MKQIENLYVQYMYSYPHKTAYGQLENVSLEKYIDRLIGKENSLYFHIPFCEYKCGYCNLFSVTGQSEKNMDDYIDAMERHAKQIAKILPKNIVFQDMTIGGGTPLILSEGQLKRVFSIASDILGFDTKNRDIVIETSPNQTTKEKLSLIKEAGVSRISIGVQSFQEKELETLHRFHKLDSVHKALERIKAEEFSCVNVDIIYGIEGQTKDSLLDSLQKALTYEPDELFVYPLYVKPGTAMYKEGAKTSREAMGLYMEAKTFLEKHGYKGYSMRRFVKQPKEKEIPYTSCGFNNTLSIGCGGRSYVGELHFCTPYTIGQKACLPRIQSYIETQDYLKIPHGYLLSKEEMKRRYVIKHLLFGRGIYKEEYRTHFKGEVCDQFAEISQWMAEGYVKHIEGYISLTEQGVLLSDWLGEKLISKEVREKSKAYYRELGF